MNQQSAGNSQEPFPFGEAVSPQENLDGNARHGTRSPLPAGWRRLRSGLRGSQLYQVARSDGTPAYWEGEMPDRGGWVHRRFASELQARAWLHLAAAPRFTLGSDSLDDVRESLRDAAGLESGVPEDDEEGQTWLMI